MIVSLRKFFSKPSYFERLLFALVLLAHLLYVFGSQSAVLDWYTTDDAFFYFKVAQNITRGNGVTFDGLNLTNGFHPLWLLINLPVFAFPSLGNILPLRVLIFVLAALNAASSVLLFRLVHRLIKNFPVAAFTSLLWAFYPPIHAVTTKGGTEAGLNAFFIILLWERLTAFNLQDSITSSKLRRIIILGLIGALAVFSRLDNIFIVFFAGLWLWLRWWNPPLVAEGTRMNAWAWRLRTGFAFFTPLTLALSAYMLWNFFSFGTPTPVSGQIKLWWGTMDDMVYGQPIENLLGYIAEFFSADPNLGPWSLITSLLNPAVDFLLTRVGVDVLARPVLIHLSALALVFLSLTAVLIYLDRDRLRSLSCRAGILPLLAASFAHIYYYKGLDSMAQKAWYWVLEMFILVLLLSIALEILAKAGNRKPRSIISRGISPALAGLSAVLVLFFFVVAIPKVKPPPRPANHFYLMRAAWVRQTFEPGAVIGTLGGGSLGYFLSEYTIINMDGLINSYEYYQHLKAGTAADYLLGNGVEFVVARQYLIEETNPYMFNFPGRLEFVSRDYGISKNMVWRLLP